MANEILWLAGTNAELISTGISNTNTKLGAEFDNSINKDVAAIRVRFKMAVAPVEGAMLRMHFLYAVDGTNYETYDADEAQVFPPVLNIPSDDSTDEQIRTYVNIPIAPFKLKALFFSELGQDTSGGALLANIYTYNEEIQ